MTLDTSESWEEDNSNELALETLDTTEEKFPTEASFSDLSFLEEDNDFALETLANFEEKTSPEELLLVGEDNNFSTEEENLSLENLENKIEVLEEISEESFEELQDLFGSVQKEKINYSEKSSR